MKNNHKALAAAVCLTLLAAGCAPKREAVSSAPAPPEKEIRWLLALEGAAYPKEWESYEVLAAISEKAGVTPVLEPLNENYAPALLKRLQSGERPALITLAAADPVCLQMEHISSVRRIDAIPALFEQLPEDIRAFHQQADGSLLYLPGGFGGEAAVPAEGIYVREEMFDTLGRPGLTDENGFFAALEAYDSWYGRNRDETKTNYLPVVFGTNGGGIQTLRHWFGLTPGTEDPAGEEALLRFLERLGRAGGTSGALEIPDASLDHLLQSEALFYIGSASRLERYSREHGDTPYRPVWPRFREGGYAMAASPYGCYATYLCAADADLGDTVRLARYLLSKEGSRTAMLGLQNRHWLETDDGGLVLFPDARDQLNADPGYAEKTGIGRVPFLSSVGAVYPGARPAGLPTRDILKALKQARYDPTTEQGLARSLEEERRTQSYKNALTIGGAG